MYTINMTDSEYKLISNDIQLVDTSIVDLNIKKVQDIGFITDINPMCDLTMKEKISNVHISTVTNSKQILAFVDTCFTCNNVNPDESMEVIVTMKLRTKSVFLTKNEDMHNSIFKNRVDVACIPLVLPFIKTNLQVLSSMVNVPFYIPTIDVVRTLNANKKQKLVDSDQRS